MRLLTFPPFPTKKKKKTFPPFLFFGWGWLESLIQTPKWLVSRCVRRLYYPRVVGLVAYIRTYKLDLRILSKLRIWNFCLKDRTQVTTYRDHLNSNFILVFSTLKFLMKYKKFPIRLYEVYWKIFVWYWILNFNWGWIGYLHYLFNILIALF